MPNSEGGQRVIPPSKGLVAEKWPVVPRSLPTSIRLRNFRFINQDLLDSYLSQLDVSTNIRKQKRSLGFQSGLPKAEWTLEDSDAERKDDKKISILLKTLDAAKLVTGQRPQGHHETVLIKRHWFM